MTDVHEVTVLWRPVGQAELELIERSGWRAFPPRLPHQPIFYPVANEEYAVQIARDWNTKDAAYKTDRVTHRYAYGHSNSDADRDAYCDADAFTNGNT